MRCQIDGVTKITLKLKGWLVMNYNAKDFGCCFKEAWNIPNTFLAQQDRVSK